MNARKRITPIILVLVFAGLLVCLSACSQPTPSMSLVDIQAEINAAVAATLQAQGLNTQEGSVKTASLANVVEAQQPTDAASPTPTLPPPPTATTAPTATPLPTATPAAPPPTSPPSAPAVAASAQPVISAEVNTNCRQGPSSGYRVESYLAVGDTSTVYGRNSAETWWYIANPTKEGKYCWVWGETTVVEGNTSALPVVEAPPKPSSYSNRPYDDYICYAHGATYPCGPRYVSCRLPEKCYWGYYCKYWSCQTKWPVYCQKKAPYPWRCLKNEKSWCKCYPWLCDDD